MDPCNCRQLASEDEHAPGRPETPNTSPAFQTPLSTQTHITFPSTHEHEHARKLSMNTHANYPWMCTQANHEHACKLSIIIQSLKSLKLANYVSKYPCEDGKAVGIIWQRFYRTQDLKGRQDLASIIIWTLQEHHPCKLLATVTSCTWAAHEQHMGCTRASYKLHTSCIWAAHELHTSNTWAAHELHMSYTWAAHARERYMSCTQTAHELHKSCIRAAYELNMSCTWAAHVLHMGYTWAAHKLHMNCT